MVGKLKYRADIDGLRAVAVLAVIASHLPEKFLPSGFLGVDVFFAISGFVVTASLMNQRRTELPQLYIGFLARRVKRLLPALLLLVAVTCTVVLLTDPFPSHSVQTGLASLFGFANILLFFFELDYFSPSSLFNAFTHTWSLGVEEQFYVVFPMFAWLFFFRRNDDSFKPLAIAMISGGLVSVTMFAALYGSHRPAAFFLMPMRIWELGVGALVYLGSSRLRSERIRGWLRRLSPLALAALGLCFLVPEHDAMPATIAAVTLTGLIMANSSRSPATRLLQLRPVVYVGKISYSLYLWHWPIIALGPIVLAASWQSSAIYVVAMSIAAVLSYHLVEQPLRFRPWTTRRLHDIGIGVAGNAVVAGVVMTALIGTSLTAESSGGVLHPPPYVAVLGNGKSHQLTCALDGGSRVFREDTVDNCTVPGNPGQPTIWTMGDSHSGHLQGMLYELHDRLGVGVHLVETPGWSFPFPAGKHFEPRALVWQEVSRRLAPGDIVLISRIYLTRAEPYEVLELRPWAYNVSRLATELEAKGVHLVVTGPPPIFPFKDVRECRLDERDNCSLERSSFAPLVHEVEVLLRGLETRHDNLAVFEMFDAVCPTGHNRCYPDDGDSYLYRDRDHFNSLGSKMLAEPFVDLLRSTNMIETGH